MQHDDALLSLLKTHRALYPLMGPRDAVKLLYQSHFAGGHMIADEKSAMERLRREYAGVGQIKGESLFVEIGGGLVRVQLCALEENGLTLESLCRAFIMTANSVRGDMGRFKEELVLLPALCEEAGFGFERAECEAYIEAYIAAGCPAVSHSEVYRTAYAPSYRVIKKSALDM